VKKERGWGGRVGPISQGYWSKFNVKGKGVIHGLPLAPKSLFRKKEKRSKRTFARG